MKKAASNIAWRAEEDTAAADLLIQHGFSGVEIAPTRVWADPLEVSAVEVHAHRKFWEARGLPIVAMQSLLFGHPEMTIFESKSARRQTQDYLTGMIRLGRDLGASVLILGSPKNRKRGHVSLPKTTRIAVDFFQELGNRAQAAGVCLCIEPNPAFYECDFVTTSAEGLALVKAVQSPGFGLHLDAAAMTLSNEEPDALAKAAGHIRHFHASEKNLEPVGSETVNHSAFGAALSRIAYAGWISIEMRAGEGENISRLARACKTVRSAYDH